MKNCHVCGAQLEDSVSVCPYCGSGMQGGYAPVNQSGMQGGYAPMNQPGQQGGYTPMGQQGGYTPMNQPGIQGGYTPMNQPGMQGGYTPVNQPGMQGGYTPVNQPGMQGGYVPVNQPGMQGGYTPVNQPGMQGGYTPMNQPGYMSEQPQNPPRKPKKTIEKKKIIIPLVSVAVAAIMVVAVWLIFFAGKLTKRQAQKTLENYALQIERKDVKGTMYSTVPKNLLARLLDDYGDGYDFDDFEEDLDYELDNNYLMDALDDAKINISNIKVNKLEKFKVENYIDYLNAQMKKQGTDVTIEDVILSDIGDDGITVEELESKFNTALAMYNIDPDDIYLVQLAFDISVKGDIGGEHISGNYSSSDIYADRAIIYKYEDRWYVIPPIESAFLPAMTSYIDKARKSNDISSAKTIKTAVETSLGNEEVYMEITEQHSDELIYVTDAGLAKLSSDTATMIKENIGGDTLPSVKYTGNGAKNFAFEVTSTGRVYVYIVGEDEEEDIWEICPEIDYEYQ